MVLDHVVARSDDQPSLAAVRREAELQGRQRVELLVVQRGAVLRAHLARGRARVRLALGLLQLLG